MKIPFNIKYRPEIESGKYKVVTREGKPVEILKWNCTAFAPVLGFFNVTGKGEQPVWFNEDGTKWSFFGETPDDLFLFTDEPELTEFERGIHRAFLCAGLENVPSGIIKDSAKELLALAKKELLSYADESNPKIEAMADLERTFSCNPDKLPKWLKDELAKKHLEGYCMGREDAMREMSDFMESHFNCEKAKEGTVCNPGPVPAGVVYKSPQCWTDVAIVPNINSGTSTLKAE